MNVRKPTHPGELLLEEVLKPLGLSITVAATHLGVTRKALSEFVHGHSGLSSEMSLKIAQATGTTPESWLAMQSKLDLWKAKQKGTPGVARFPELVAR